MPDRSRVKNRPELAGAGADRAAFAERLKVIVGHWPSAERLARTVGVSPSAFRKWMRGEAEPSRDRLIALSQTTGVTLSWLVQGIGPPPTSAELADGTAVPGPIHDKELPAGFVLLPDHPLASAAGSGGPSPGPARRFIGFRSDWIRNVLGIEPASVQLETAIGDSMAPHIGDGDLLLVDSREPRISDFGIYVLEVGGERLVKRVQRRFDGALILLSDNPIYQPEEIGAELAATITVIGKVVWRGGRL